MRTSAIKSPPVAAEDAEDAPSLRQSVYEGLRYRLITGRIGYLLDTSRDDEIPDSAGTVDLRIALPIAGLAIARRIRAEDAIKTGTLITGLGDLVREVGQNEGIELGAYLNWAKIDEVCRAAARHQSPSASAVGLIDVGCSAGLNLNVDRVGITYSNGQLLGDYLAARTGVPVEQSTPLVEGHTGTITPAAYLRALLGGPKDDALRDGRVAIGYCDACLDGTCGVLLGAALGIQGNMVLWSSIGFEQFDDGQAPKLTPFWKKSGAEAARPMLPGGRGGCCRGPCGCG